MRTVQGTDKDGNKIEMNIDELFFRPAVYGIVFRDKEVLMFNQNFGYTLPGGGVDIGETLEEALVREMKEETGYSVKIINIVEVKTNFFKLPGSNKNCQTIRMFFLCKIISNEILEIKLEKTEIAFNSKPEWVNLDNLDKIKIGDTDEIISIIKKSLN
ncbi:MAG: NUDIX domain-containing protein [Candidatus Magasanikbacteria bacterium]